MFHITPSGKKIFHQKDFYAPSTDTNAPGRHSRGSGTSSEFTPRSVCLAEREQQSRGADRKPQTQKYELWAHAEDRGVAVRVLNQRVGPPTPVRSQGVTTLWTPTRRCGSGKSSLSSAALFRAPRRGADESVRRPTVHPAGCCLAVQASYRPPWGHA